MSLLFYPEPNLLSKSPFIHFIESTNPFLAYLEMQERGDILLIQR